MDGMKHECELVQSLIKNQAATIPVNAFGSSDCSNGCPAHLIAFPLQFDLDHLFKLTRACFFQLDRLAVPLNEID